MGRPCKCCGECEPTKVLCYIESGIIHIEITNAKSVTAYYVNPETAPDITGFPDAYRVYLSTELTEMLDEDGNLHYTLPLSTIEYYDGSVYFLNVSATNSCSTDSCTLSCSGGISCQIFILERHPISGEDRCNGEYEIRWGTWILSGNADQNYNFNEDTKFFINGQEVAPEHVDESLANGSIYVDACSLADKYTLTVEASFCTTPSVGECTFEPSCLDKKNSIVTEVVGVPDEIKRISESKSYEFNCGDLFRHTIAETKFTGLGGFNGTHVFPKCGESYYLEPVLGSPNPRAVWYQPGSFVGTGQEIWTTTTEEWYTDFSTFPAQRVSFTNVVVNKWDVVYYLHPGPLINSSNSNLGLIYGRYASYDSAGTRTQHGEPGVDYPYPTYGLFYFGHPCDYEQADGTIIPAGTWPTGDAQAGNLPIFDNGGAPYGCGTDVFGNSNANNLDPGKNVACCVPVCYDGYQNEDPILPWALLNFKDSYYDPCFPENNSEFGYNSYGTVRSYYACL